MPLRLLIGLRWVAVAVIVLAIALIIIRRKLPPRGRTASEPAPDLWRELWLRWREAREDGRIRSANVRALRGKRVLIVDPEEKSTRVLTWRLHKLRCSIQRARTAYHALNLAQEHEPEVVVADALLPDMTAVEFYQSLPRQDVPVIFVGALPDQWDRLRALGPNVACMSKPFEPDDVASLAGMILRRDAVLPHVRIVP